MHRLARPLFYALCLLVLLASCGDQEPTAATESQLITVCSPGGFAPTASPPTAQTCTWQPTWSITTWESTLRMCSPSAPPVTGEVAVFDKTMVQVNGNWSFPPGTQCATLNDSGGGWADWFTFQAFGWSTPSNTSIRSLQLGPGTNLFFNDRPLDVTKPHGCAIGSICIGVAGDPATVRNVPDVRTIFPGFPSFYMASLHIERQ